MVAARPRRRMVRWTPVRPVGLRNVGTSRPRSLAARPSERAASANRIVRVGGYVFIAAMVRFLPSPTILIRGCDNDPVENSPNDGTDVDDSRITDLNPAQQAVLDELGAPAAERPEFPDDLRHHLRTAIETAVEPLLDDLPAGDDLFVNKHRLGRVHGCEARFVAEEAEDFAWSVPIARGTITHKAVELAINWRREIEPPVLVDEALARYEQDSGDFGRWLQRCSEVERAELRSDSLDAFTKFIECFPPLKPGWRPVTESRLRAELCNGRLILAGKSDLTLGAAAGQARSSSTSRPVASHPSTLTTSASTPSSRRCAWVCRPDSSPPTTSTRPASCLRPSPKTSCGRPWPVSLTGSGSSWS